MILSALRLASFLHFSVVFYLFLYIILFSPFYLIFRIAAFLEVGEYSRLFNAAHQEFKGSVVKS